MSLAAASAAVWAVLALADIAPAAAPAAAPARPAIVSPRQLAALLRGEEGVRAYLGAQRTPERVFNAGLYYMLNAAGALDALDGAEASRRRNLDAAIALLEEAFAQQPRNAAYQGVLGDAYGMKAGMTAYPELLTWAKKCQAALNRAVRIADGAPEIRLLRLRSFAHFPAAYYPELRPTIVADGDAALDWAARAEAAGKTDAGWRDLYATYLIDVKNEVLVLLAGYFDEQVKDRETARAYLRRADASCARYCAAARDMLAHLR
jgi:hypothetical protein